MTTNRSLRLLIAGLGFAAATAGTTLLSPVAARADLKANTPILCAVKGEEIKDVAKAAGKADYNGKTYYFCCGGCKAAFGKDQARFSKMTDLRTEKIVLQKKLESVNAELSTLEKSGAATTKKKADASAAVTPAAGSAATLLRCALTDEEIASVAQAAGKADFNGKTYYFCCGGCVTKFNSDPAKYAAAADARAAKASAR